MRFVALALAVVLQACAGPGTEQHIAPLYTHISTPGGGEEYEALAGAVIARRHNLGQPLDSWGLRPFFIHYRNKEERSRTEFLYPFGRVVRGGGEFKWWILPLADYRRETTPEGRKWSFLALPGVYVARLPDGRHVQAWFPIGGHVEELLSFDRLDFVLWPLWMRSERQGLVTYHFPFPFLSYSEGANGGGWRVWPLAGHTWMDDRYDRWFVLWPFFTRNRENLKASPEFHQTQWALFPLWGEVQQGTYRSTTVLWPFFGYARDSATGFWSWDGPWPLVRVQRPGNTSFRTAPEHQGSRERTRFWPFYSQYRGDGLDSRWYPWPLVNERWEQYRGKQRHALTFVPFWSSWEETHDDGTEVEFEKLWPLQQYYRRNDTEELLFPALSPFWRWPELDEHYSWLYEIYNGKIGPDTAHERGFLGLWRRTKDLDEERVYVSGLYSRRIYSERGKRVTEHSALFGLLRWRADENLTMLRPAFPGPGWPIERVPNSIAPATGEGSPVEEPSTIGAAQEGLDS